MDKFRIYSLAVVALAGFALVLLVSTASAHTPPFAVVGPGLAAFLLLGILAEALSLPLKGAKAVTSISFLLHLASVLLFGPLWSALQAALAELTVELWVRKRIDRFIAVFNTSQIFLSVGMGGLCYSAIVGQEPAAVTMLRLFAFIVLVLVYFLVNSITVCLGASIKTGEAFSAVWREMGASTFVYDMVSAPFGFFIALLYNRAGLPAAVLILLFILYLRHIYQQHLKLQQLNRDLVHVLIKTIEHRDPYTSGHSLRVAEVSKAIGSALRFHQRRLEQLEIAALFHDIGKIGAAYNDIISNPGRLSEEQKEIIRSHPVRGAELLASMESIEKDVVAAVRHHHEFYNGTGYPEGLAGDQIPIFARIIMLADSIDAMGSARAYRGPLSPEVIAGELMAHAGQQFDPKLVAIVIAEGILQTALGLARRDDTAVPPSTEVQTLREPHRQPVLKIR